MTPAEEQLIAYGGVVDDPRPEAAKAQDYRAEEVMAFAPATWREYVRSEWSQYPIRMQDGSLTCVAQTGAKLLGIDNYNEEGLYMDFSAYDIYDRRNNKPSGGMWGQDALQILCKGATTEQRLPSQNLSEAQMNLPVVRNEEDLRIQKKYRAGGYVQPPIDFDVIASIIQHQKKGVMLFFKFDYDEWTDTPFLRPGSKLSCHHSVTGTLPILLQGKQYILIDDSWGRFYGLAGQRLISREFFEARCTFAGFTLDLKNEEQPEFNRPAYTFKESFQFGAKGEEVKRLQDILRYEGFFPAKVPSTGLFLQITAKALLQWQQKHKVATPEQLTEWGGKFFGPKTRAKMNELYFVR